MHTYRTRPHCYLPDAAATEPLDPGYRRAQALPPAGALLAFESRAAVSGRPGAARVGTQAGPGAAGRPSWSRLPSRVSPKRRRRKTPSWPTFLSKIWSARAARDAGVPLPHPGICERLPASFVSSTDSWPSRRSARWPGWLGPSEFDSRGDRLDDRETLADRPAAWRPLWGDPTERGTSPAGGGPPTNGVRLPARSLDHRDGRPVRSIRGRGPPSSGPPSPTPVSLVNHPSQARESVPLPDAPASPAWQLSNRSDRFPHSGAAVAVVRPTRAARTPALSSTAAACAAVRLRRSALRRTARLLPCSSATRAPNLPKSRRPGRARTTAAHADRGHPR
jgi:hypothetical protein